MKTKRIIEFKDAVVASGYEFQCDYSHLKKLTVPQLAEMWEKLLERRTNEITQFTPERVTSHHIGKWIGISLCGDGNLGISESIAR